MQESPHKTILDREQTARHAEEYFSPQLMLLRDLANYGSNLIVRAYNSSPKKMTDIVACGVLLKQVVAMLDAAEVQLTAGIAHAAFLPARAAFEASIYSDWILIGDSERKAMCYIVGNYREERLWASRVIHGTNEEKAFAEIVDPLDLNLHKERPTLLDEAMSHLTEVNRILAQPELRVIDLEFDQKRGKRKNDVEWYELSGIQSVRQLAKAVNRLPEYEIFYGKGSQVTHSASYKDHIKFSNDQVHFGPIRHLAEFNTLMKFLVSIAMGTYRQILSRYRPGELMAFNKKYMEDWREPFLNIKQVTYQS